MTAKSRNVSTSAKQREILIAYELFNEERKVLFTVDETGGDGWRAYAFKVAGITRVPDRSYVDVTVIDKHGSWHVIHLDISRGEGTLTSMKQDEPLVASAS